MRLALLLLLALILAMSLLPLAGCVSLDESTGRTEYGFLGIPISFDEPAEPDLAETAPWKEDGFAELPEDVQVAVVRTWNYQHGDSGGSHWSWPALVAMGLIGLRQVTPTGLRNWRTVFAPSTSWPETGHSLLALTGIGTTPDVARPKQAPAPSP